MLPCAFDRLVPYREPRVGAGEELRSAINQRQSRIVGSKIRPLVRRSMSSRHLESMQIRRRFSTPHSFAINGFEFTAANLPRGSQAVSGCRRVHRVRYDCLLSGSGRMIAFLNSLLDLRIKLRRLPAIGHPVLTDDPNLTMTQFAADYRLGYPPIGGGSISP